MIRDLIHFCTSRASNRIVWCVLALMMNNDEISIYAIILTVYIYYSYRNIIIKVCSKSCLRLRYISNILWIYYYNNMLLWLLWLICNIILTLLFSKLSILLFGSVLWQKGRRQRIELKRLHGQLMMRKKIQPMHMHTYFYGLNRKLQNIICV